jgi:hypothetical protein
VPLVVQHRDRLGESVRAAQSDDVGDRLVRSEKLAELRNAAVVAVGLLDDILIARVNQMECQSGHQKAGLSCAILEVSH